MSELNLAVNGRLSLSSGKKKTRANQPSEDVPLLFGLPLRGISKEKKKDVLDLCKSKQIPEMYQEFYERLFENMTDENDIDN